MPELNTILAAKKNLIVDRWAEAILATYPSESLRYLASQKDRFANPIGHAVRSSSEKLFDELVHGNDGEKIRASLDDFLRMRAVQDFAPSEAVGFVFMLKRVLRDITAQEMTGKGQVSFQDELLNFESRIDSMALVAFDLYMEAREKLFRIRIDEVKARSLLALSERQ
ncbi:MAG: RsbRD N-terminal domain-containing protein [Bacteroidetes bacterium]|nr:RsbRD N-terminal domain-containing protein [Bacteroidota bacterium]